MLRLRLELDGHEVHETEDGITGLAEARGLQPDVAVIDIGLPGLDGWELARQLRATEAGRRMILVAISGYGATGGSAALTRGGLRRPMDDRGGAPRIE